MSQGMTTLEANIAKFEQLLADLRTATSEGHAVIKDMKAERKAIEALLSKTAEEHVDEAIRNQLGPMIEEFGSSLERKTKDLYHKIGEQVDLIINLSIGKPFESRRITKQDLRPVLAAGLRTLIEGIIDDLEGENERAITAAGSPASIPAHKGNPSV